VITLNPTTKTVSLSPSESAMRILVVEDDAKIASFVVNGLKQNASRWTAPADVRAGAFDGLDDGVRRGRVVWDVLPKLDGLTLVQKLRKDSVRVPVIILSAKATVDDRVKGLQAGGDRLRDQAVRVSELLGARAGLDTARDQRERADAVDGGRRHAGLCEPGRSRERGERIDLQARCLPCWNI